MPLTLIYHVRPYIHKWYIVIFYINTFEWGCNSVIIMNNRKVLCTQPRFLVQYFYTQIHLKYCQEIAWVQYYVSRNEEQCVRRVHIKSFNIDIPLKWHKYIINGISILFLKIFWAKFRLKYLFVFQTGWYEFLFK